MLYEGDCLEIMPTLADKSVDMILCDLPYGTTACKWDTIIPFEPLWKQYKRLIKDNGAIVLTASQPFTSALVISNIKMFKYEMIMTKRPVGHLLSNKRPMQSHENILVFYKSQPVFNKQMQERTKHELSRLGNIKKTFSHGNINSEHYRIKSKLNESYNPLIKNPNTVLNFNSVNSNSDDRFHPTQKPVALFEYLIRTYTNEGDMVLDNCAGSGTTGVACLNTNRKYILIEKDAGYCEIIRKRIANTQPLLLVS
jgi:site-specific DNA-methyltransferase (adenine-specific)